MSESGKIKRGRIFPIVFSKAEMSNLHWLKQDIVISEIFQKYSHFRLLDLNMYYDRLLFEVVAFKISFK